jgi:acyl carrier protein
VAGVLGKRVEPGEPLMEAGLDSLGAVELRNALGSEFRAELPATVTFDYPSISALAGFLAGELHLTPDQCWVVGPLLLCSCQTGKRSNAAIGDCTAS